VRTMDSQRRPGEQRREQGNPATVDWEKPARAHVHIQRQEARRRMRHAIRRAPVRHCQPARSRIGAKYSPPTLALDVQLPQQASASTDRNRDKQRVREQCRKLPSTSVRFTDTRPQAAPTAQ